MTNNPRISLITPTCDRQSGIALCERWMARQTVPFHEWIVADGGTSPAELSMGQIRTHKKMQAGAENLCHNLLRAIQHVTGDVVLIVEDDDNYRPDHIETCLRHLERHRAVGCMWLNYYNLQFRKWRRIRNSCAALCNTAFRRECLPLLAEAAEQAMAEGIYHVDRLFWRRVGASGLHTDETVIGIKGLPGMKGIGIGHRPGAGWRPDPKGAKLREWIGEDSEAYGI